MGKTKEGDREPLQVMSKEEHVRIFDPQTRRSLYDFEICVGADDLARTIHHINRYGYRLITVTQYKDEYTVFFRRHLHENP